jgi:hypothetical protein
MKSFLLDPTGTQPVFLFSPWMRSGAKVDYKPISLFVWDTYRK